MEIKGTIIKIGEKKTVGANNSELIEFVIKTEGQYPQELPFQSWKSIADKIEQMNVGDEVTVHYNLRGKEFNGKHYLSGDCWKVVVDRAAVPAAVNDIDTAMENKEEEAGDGLPF
jgi:single-strand DNA-binding protein